MKPTTLPLNLGAEDDRQPISNLSWSTIHGAVEVLAHQIKALKPHTLVAIARGGLIPATLLSHKLNCPLEVIHASAYQGTRRTLQKPIRVEGFKEQFNQAGTIFIDDIMDSGDTWDAVLYGDGRQSSNMKGCLFTIAAKGGRRYPNWQNYYLQVPSDVWVKFPWESE